jgi:hypothetical protein
MTVKMEASLFNKLPGELRNRIYELALLQFDGVTVFVPGIRPHLFRPTETKNILALTETCKEMHNEASPVFYRVNKFVLISKYLGERYSGDIQNARNSQWKRGLCDWLALLGSRNTAALTHVEVDIGTSFLYNYVPSSESIWRSVASVRSLFGEKTLVCMKTELDWTYESRRAFYVCIPLNDAAAAWRAVNEALEQQREELLPWCNANHAGARRTEYMRVELATATQELQGFVHLLEIMAGEQKHR